MKISTIQAFNRAYIVFAENPVLWTWNMISDTNKTWSRMKIQLSEAQHDLISIHIVWSLYNTMQSNYIVTIPDDDLTETPTLRDSFF